MPPARPRGPPRLVQEGRSCHRPKKVRIFPEAQPVGARGYEGLRSEGGGSHFARSRREPIRGEAGERIRSSALLPKQKMHADELRLEPVSAEATCLEARRAFPPVQLEPRWPDHDPPVNDYAVYLERNGLLRTYSFRKVFERQSRRRHLAWSA